MYPYNRKRTQSHKKKSQPPTGAGGRLFFSFAPANESARVVEESLFDVSALSSSILNQHVLPPNSRSRCPSPSRARSFPEAPALVKRNLSPDSKSYAPTTDSPAATYYSQKHPAPAPASPNSALSESPAASPESSPTAGL